MQREELVCQAVEFDDILVDVHQASLALWQLSEKSYILRKRRYFMPYLLIYVEYIVECFFNGIRSLYFERLVKFCLISRNIMESNRMLRV